MSVRSPQLFHEAAVTDIESFITDPAWALEQKVDGMRCMTVVTARNIDFLTRGGRPLKSSAAKLHFDSIRAGFESLQSALISMEHVYPNMEIVFDGEIMPDQSKLVLLDLVFSELPNYYIKPTDAFSIRRNALRSMWHTYQTSDAITIVAHANKEAYKRTLVEDIMKVGGEGLIAKRLDSPYSEGDRVRHSLKLKFTSTADVVVTAKNSGESKHSIRGGDKINFEFGVVGDDGELVHMGNCSGIGKEPAEVGDVIEVEYLYVGAGGRLVQPRMVKRRDDKSAVACRTEQFRTYSKDVL